IARQDLSNAQAEGLIEHFGSVLADNGGKLVDSEYWGVKTMAYKINIDRSAFKKPVMISLRYVFTSSRSASMSSPVTIVSITFS
ncbi:MAG: 30S ribosomal protein S6, partial [Ectothiorhodospiraceae bacterium]